MGDLAQRMDAGIGAAGAMDRHGLAAKLRDRGFERLLHRQPLRLALPADEPGAVIFDRQLVAGHGNKVPAGIGQPRRNAAASSGARPGRCSLNGRSAPDPQAIDSRSSSTVPGGSPTVSRQRRCGEHSDVFAAEFEERARPRVERAHPPLQLLGGLPPVEPALLAEDFWRVGDAVLRLRPGRQARRAPPRRAP